MGQDRSKRGVERLAAAIDSRVGEQQDTSLVLDFAEVLGDGSILPNTFRKVIPLRDYMACRTAGQRVIDGEVLRPQIMPGDRVLIAWVQDEPVVVDVITRAENIVGR